MTLRMAGCWVVFMVPLVVAQTIETVPENFTQVQPIETGSQVQSSSFPTEKEDFNFTGTSSSTSTPFKDINEVLASEEHPDWYKDAIKDIAYYLRAHKFNEYDRRYNRDDSQHVERTNFKHFPKPPLRSLHWEVNRYCESSFLHCVDYLRKKLKHVALKRQDDTSVVMLENNWPINSTQTRQIEEECQRMRQVDDLVSNPFEGPLERYQWRTTASYFLCWYTMNEVPDLEHFGERCDNFANCLTDNTNGPTNNDVRANDKQPFACARYSFCPDACCPYKHLRKWDSCYESEKNPCFYGNSEGQRECGFKRIENRDFGDIILNKWNVSCKCTRKGFVWSSLYGICVDVDECTRSESNTCTKSGEACINAPGSFRCVCKWGFAYSQASGKCVISDAISDLKLESRELLLLKKNAGNKWRNFVRSVLRIIGKSSSFPSRISIKSLAIFSLLLRLCL